LRFAIKEAALKALGTGWVDGIAFTDIAVVAQQTLLSTAALDRRLVAIYFVRTGDRSLVA